MYDTYQMQEHLCKELEKKGQSGIKSTADLDTVWKLIDAYKNLLKIDMLQEAEEYSHNGYSQTGYSERRKRDSMGRYSRADGHYEGGSSYRGGNYRDGYSGARDAYMDAQHSYRSTRSPESKRDMTESLTECLGHMRGDLQEMLANAGTREEREKIKEMIREIGNLA